MIRRHLVLCDYGSLRSELHSGTALFLHLVFGEGKEEGNFRRTAPGAALKRFDKFPHSLPAPFTAKEGCGGCGVREWGLHGKVSFRITCAKGINQSM